MNIPASFMLVSKGFQLLDFCKMLSFVGLFLVVQVGHFCCAPGTVNG